MVPAASFRFAAEMLEVIAAEERATRNRHDHIFGGGSPATTWCGSEGCATTDSAALGAAGVRPGAPGP
jgi:hypothetical protein